MQVIVYNLNLDIGNLYYMWRQTGAENRHRWCCTGFVLTQVENLNTPKLSLKKDTDRK
jgi:hypothetical protein